MWQLPRPKPFALWLLGEPTYAHLYLNFQGNSDSWRLTPGQDQEFRRLMKLFPEATVQLHVQSGLRFLPLPSDDDPSAVSVDVGDDPFRP